MVFTLDVSLDGRRHQVTADRLDLGDLSSDRELRQAVATWLGVAPARLQHHSILRLPTGRVLLRVPLGLRLARLVQRLIEQESRIREALNRTVAGVFAHPRLRRGLGLAVGSLRTLAAGIRAAGDPLGHLGRLLALGARGALGQVAGRAGTLLELLEGGVRQLVQVLWPGLSAAGRFALQLIRGWRLTCQILLGLGGRASRPLGDLIGLLMGAWQVLAQAGRARLGRLQVWSGGPVQQIGRGLARFRARAGRLLLGLTSPLRGALSGVRAGGQRVSRRLRPWIRVAWGWLVGTVDRIVTGRTPQERERDHRLQLLDSLLTTPHGELAGLWPFHHRLSQDDPLFYGHLAAWYSHRGQLRDHQEMFVITLVVSPLSEHRELGLALLRRLPPYEVGRVLDFIRGTSVRGRRRGLFRTPPRSLRTEIERYLREREANPSAFDGAVLAARGSLKRLYTTLHIRPSERAQAILFDGQPPRDSRLFALKELARLRDPARQAELLRRTAVPYKVAVSVLGELTSELAEALVARMSPQEVINHMATLRRRGALEYPEVAALVERKLAEAGSHQRVSAYKAAQAAQVVPEWGERLRQVTQEQLLRRGSLTVSTALLVDASASMGESLEVGKRVASMLASVTQAELVVLAFNARAQEIRSQGPSHADWEQAFRNLRAEGATSPGSAVAWLLREDRRVEQLVIVSDQRENQRPRLAATLRLYRRRVPHLRVTFITLPGGGQELHRQCQRLGLESRDHAFSGDYYSLPDLLPMLSAPTRLGMLTEILETSWPRRN